MAPNSLVLWPPPNLLCRWGHPEFWQEALLAIRRTPWPPGSLDRGRGSLRGSGAAALGSGLSPKTSAAW